MKCFYAFLGAFAVLILGITACGDPENDGRPIVDYAIWGYEVPDSIAIESYPERSFLRFHVAKRYQLDSISKEYTEYSVRYGDRKAKQRSTGYISVVVGVEQLQMVQRDAASGDTLDVSPFYEVTYFDTKDYVQRGDNYRWKHSSESKEVQVSMAECKGEICQWLFLNGFTRVRLLDEPTTIRPDSTTTLVVTLSDGKMLTAPWLKR